MVLEAEDMEAGDGVTFIVSHRTNLVRDWYEHYSAWAYCRVWYVESFGFACTTHWPDRHAYRPGNNSLRGNSRSHLALQPSSQG